MSEEKKSIFERAIDALTDRDEKETAPKPAPDKTRAGEARQKAETALKRAAQNTAADKAAAEKAVAQKAAADRAALMKAAGENAAAERTASASRKGIVSVRSLRIRADHSTSARMVGGLVNGDEVAILSTWSDGRDTWARLDKGWAAMVYNGETYIKVA